MAKFLKSIFQPTEKRKSIRREGESEEERGDDPPLNSRRKLSTSRSGRLKQAIRKRHSLTLDLYGEDNNMRTVEKPKSMEYHVHSPENPSLTDPNLDGNQRRRSAEKDPRTDEIVQKKVAEKPRIDKTKIDNRIASDGAKSPEEEIDSAFEIIDKS